MASTTGKLFTAIIGASTTITGLVRGEFQDVADELDSTDSDSAPWQDTDIGTIGKRMTLDGHFRPGGMQYPTLKVGTTLTALKVYPHGITEDYYFFPLAIVLPGSTSVEIKGKVEYSIIVASKGIFYEPGDTIPP